jgi:hypothetical protein
MKLYRYSLIMYFILPVSCSPTSVPKPESSYILLISSNPKKIDVFGKESLFSMRSAYCYMGLDQTDLEDLVNEGGCWITKDQLVVLGDGGVASILLEKLDQSCSRYRFSVSRSELGYVDVSLIILSKGKWNVVSTQTDKSDYFYEQLVQVKNSGSRIRPNHQ